MKLPIPKFGKRGRGEDAENAIEPESQAPAPHELFDTIFRGGGRRQTRQQHRQAKVSVRSPGTEGPILDDYPGATDHGSGVRALAFDTYHSTVFEPIFRALLVAGLVCLILVATFAAYKINRAVSPDPATVSGGQSAASVLGRSGSSTQSAADLATAFADAYLATNPALAPEDYAARLEPYLHPKADPALFAPTVPTSATVKVVYTSVRSVKRVGGVDRYRVLLDARTLTDAPSDEPEGETRHRGSEPVPSGSTDTEALTLGVYTQVGGDGSASVVAPPTVSEAGQTDAGSPGVFGGDDAEPLTGPALEAVLDEFFERLYASEDLRPLVEEHLAEGVAVKDFPPEGHSYEGMERAALYRVMDSTPQDAGIEFDDLFHAEIYVRTTDASGARRLHSHVLTIGQKEDGKWLITTVS